MERDEALEDAADALWSLYSAVFDEIGMSPPFENEGAIMQALEQAATAFESLAGAGRDVRWEERRAVSSLR